MGNIEHWLAYSRSHGGLLAVLDTEEQAANVAATDRVEGPFVPAEQLRGAVSRCAEADRLLRAAYAHAHSEDVPVDVLMWLNPDTGGQ
jgi:hypothetical protein